MYFLLLLLHYTPFICTIQQHICTYRGTTSNNNNNNDTKIQIVEQTAAIANGKLQKYIYKYKNKETLNHFHDRPRKKVNKNSE